MKELEDLAESIRGQLNLSYDAQSVKFIEGFIERQRFNFSKEERGGLVNSMGCFIGQCIIKNYGGRWHVEEDSRAVCIAFDEQNKVFPFAKTEKQFENGLEDSVYSFYTIIPRVFELESIDVVINRDLPENKLTQETKKWWKFW